MKNKFILYSLIIGFIGFFVSAYLTVMHYKNIVPPCTATFGCETVLTSKYSMIGPIPLALTGALFFLFIMFLCLLIITNYKKIFLDLFYLSSAIGLLVSFVLIYIQAGVLHAFCQYCLICESASIGIAILGYLDYKERKTVDKTKTKV